MRVVLFPMLLLISVNLPAQDNTIPAFPELPRKYKAQAMKPYAYSRPVAILKPGPGITTAETRLLTTSNGKPYFLLRQDFMPCITPGMQHYRMPDGRDDAAILAKPAAPIPNAAQKKATLMP